MKENELKEKVIKINNFIMRYYQLEAKIKRYEKGKMNIAEEKELLLEIDNLLDENVKKINKVA